MVERGERYQHANKMKKGTLKVSLLGGMGGMASVVLMAYM